MSWMADRQTWRTNPRALWPDAQTIIMLGESYAPEHDPTDILKHPEKGAISVYAQNRDYHDLVKKRLKRLARWLIAHSGGEVKVFVDTAPVSEKPLGRQRWIIADPADPASPPAQQMPFPRHIGWMRVVVFPI